MWGEFHFGKVLGTVLSDKSGCVRKALAVSFVECLSCTNSVCPVASCHRKCREQELLYKIHLAYNALLTAGALSRQVFITATRNYPHKKKLKLKLCPAAPLRRCE